MDSGGSRTPSSACPPPFNNLGVALKEQSRLEDAAAAYRQAIALAPRHADAWHNLGNALKILGRIDEALSAYGEAIRLRPYHGEAYRNLARKLYTAGRHQEVAAAYRQWLEREPGHPATALARGVPGAGGASACGGRLRRRHLRQLRGHLRPGARAARLPGPRAARRRAPHGPGRALRAPRGARRGVRHRPVRPLPRAPRAEARGDALCYFGDLGLVLAAAARALRPGGVLAFTLEAAGTEPPEGYRIQPHGRYSRRVPPATL